MKPTIVQAVWGEVPEELKGNTANVEAFASVRGWGYRMATGPALDKGVDAARIEWDRFKFLTLATVPDTIMCDLDCVPLDGFEYVEDNASHCAFFPAISRPECQAQPDTFLCYGPTEWWDKQLTKATERGMLSVSCFPRKLLRDNPDIIAIPHAHWVHGMYTASRDGAIDALTGKRRREQAV